MNVISILFLKVGRWEQWFPIVSSFIDVFEYSYPAIPADKKKSNTYIITKLRANDFFILITMFMRRF